MTKREEVVAEARSWISTPYAHRGRIKGYGVDCGQILIEVYQAVGLAEKVDAGMYSCDWHLHRSEERYLGIVSTYADPVAEPLPGDIVLFKFGRCISHGGIVVAWPLIIHSYIGQGVIYGDATKGALASRLAGFWRVKGIDQ